MTITDEVEEIKKLAFELRILVTKLREENALLRRALAVVVEPTIKVEMLDGREEQGQLEFPFMKDIKATPRKEPR